MGLKCEELVAALIRGIALIIGTSTDFMSACSIAHSKKNAMLFG